MSRLIVLSFLALSAAALAGDAAARSQVETRHLASLSDDIERVSEHVGQAVVQVFTLQAATSDETPAGRDVLVHRQSSGSGVIVAAGGLVVTNAHVVEHARSVQVMLPTREAEGSPGRSALKPRGRLVDARILGVDEETDLAVLQLEAERLPFLELGDSDELRAGELVLAFGSPMGLANSVSLGIVSATARQLAPEDPMVYIQTDAPINPGNSGGPLIDARGRVMGINTFIVSQSGGNEGLGFAVPSNIVRHVYQEIRDHGRVRRGVIGVYAQTITPELAIALGLKRDWGVVVGDVFPGGPGFVAGVEVGDVILSLDGKTMENGRQLDVNLYRKPIGEAVTLGVLRGEETIELRTMVASRGDHSLRLGELVDLERDRIPQIGIIGLDLTQGLLEAVPSLRSDEGVMVAARLPGGPGVEDALRLGDVIRAVNGRPVRDMNQLRAVVGNVAEGGPIVAHVEREGRFAFVQLRQ